MFHAPVVDLVEWTDVLYLCQIPIARPSTIGPTPFYFGSIAAYAPRSKYMYTYGDMKLCCTCCTSGKYAYARGTLKEENQTNVNVRQTNNFGRR